MKRFKRLIVHGASINLFATLASAGPVPNPTSPSTNSATITPPYPTGWNSTNTITASPYGSATAPRPLVTLAPNQKLAADSSIAPHPSDSCKLGITTVKYTAELCSSTRIGNDPTQTCTLKPMVATQCRAELTFTSSSMLPSSSSMPITSTSSSASSTISSSLTASPSVRPGSQQLQWGFDSKYSNGLRDIMYAPENHIVNIGGALGYDAGQLELQVFNLFKGYSLCPDLACGELNNVPKAICVNGLQQQFCVKAITQASITKREHNDHNYNDVVVDEETQALEAAELAPEASATTSLPSDITPAATLTPVCILTAGTPMETGDFNALTSVLLWQFESMEPLFSPNTELCQPISVASTYLCRCSSGDLTGDYRANIHTTTKTQGTLAYEIRSSCNYHSWPGTTWSVATSLPGIEPLTSIIPFVNDDLHINCNHGQYGKWKTTDIAAKASSFYTELSKSGTKAKPTGNAPDLGNTNNINDISFENWNSWVWPWDKKNSGFKTQIYHDAVSDKDMVLVLSVQYMLEACKPGVREVDFAKMDGNDVARKFYDYVKAGLCWQADKNGDEWEDSDSFKNKVLTGYNMFSDCLSFNVSGVYKYAHDEQKFVDLGRHKFSNTSDRYLNTTIEESWTWNTTNTARSDSRRLL